MTRSGSKSQPRKPNPPNKDRKEVQRKPLQVMHISRKDEKETLEKIPEKPLELDQASQSRNQTESDSPNRPNTFYDPSVSRSNQTNDDIRHKSTFNSDKSIELSSEAINFSSLLDQESFEKNIERSVDDFDFDEDEFLAALDQNEPVGSTGEIAKGAVIAIESDGIYVDIGGKAPGFMPKNECGLGVITNIKERFPIGMEVEVLVTREQNADGMVTISCRALLLRKSWEKVCELAKEGKVVKVKVNGFNRGGITCDLEGLRGFVPRSQLEQGNNHESLVGKTLSTAFLEVNPDTRKLVLSEKKAFTAAKFAELELGQLVEGEIISIKPYGFFIELGGVSGLLHHSMVTNGSMRSLREVFNQGEHVKALITELDPGRGRIGLNTALLEGLPGELLVEKDKVMAEASERAIKAKSLIKEKENQDRESKSENNEPRT